MSASDGLRHATSGLTFEESSGFRRAQSGLNLQAVDHDGSSFHGDSGIVVADYGHLHREPRSCKKRRLDDDGVGDCSLRRMTSGFTLEPGKASGHVGRQNSGFTMDMHLFCDAASETESGQVRRQNSGFTMDMRLFDDDDAAGKDSGYVRRQKSGFTMDMRLSDDDSVSEKHSGQVRRQKSGFAMDVDLTDHEPLPQKTRKKVVVMHLADRWRRLVASGQKTVEVRSCSEHWLPRLRNATHVVFKRGYSNEAADRLVETKILSIDLVHGDEWRKWGIPPPGTLQYQNLFGPFMDLFAITFEPVCMKSSICVSVDGGDGDGHASLARAFAWPMVFWRSLKMVMGGVEQLKQSLLGQVLNISTHCSGIGAAEVATAMLCAHSKQALGFPVRINCKSVCDTSSVCRGILARRQQHEQDAWHIFDDIFHMFPGWDQQLRSPDIMAQELRRTCETQVPRVCHQHGQKCAHPLVHGDVCGSPCQPWSRYGVRLGCLSAVGMERVFVYCIYWSKRID